MTRLRFNLNERIFVKLTNEGKRILREDRERFNKEFPRANLGPYVEMEPDERGFVSFQGWDLMETFGAHMRLACELPFALEVEIDDSTLYHPKPTPASRNDRQVELLKLAVRDEMKEQ